MSIPGFHLSNTPAVFKCSFKIIRLYKLSSGELISGKIGCPRLSASLSAASPLIECIFPSISETLSVTVDKDKMGCAAHCIAPARMSCWSVCAVS